MGCNVNSNKKQIDRERISSIIKEKFFRKRFRIIFLFIRKNNPVSCFSCLQIYYMRREIIENMEIRYRYRKKR